MTYNYRWTGSTITGAIAPLDNTSRTVKIHMKRFSAYAPRESLIMGVPWYGYDWPVTSTVPNATVRSDKTKYGAVKSVTYASARTFLAAHPEVTRMYDVAEGSGFYTYWDASHATYRQVYFEDERSAAAKYEYAITSGYAGVGIWTLGNDHPYPEMRNALEVFFDPDHDVRPTGDVHDIARLSGAVSATLDYRIQNEGDVPEAGAIRWIARDPDGRPLAKGTVGTTTVGAGKTRAGTAKVALGDAAKLAPGTWTMTVYFATDEMAWESPPVPFRQPF